MNFARAIWMFGEHHARAWRRDDTCLVQQGRAAIAEAFDPFLRLRNGGARLLTAPDLAAEPGRIIEHSDALAARGGSACGSEAGRAGTDHHDIKFKSCAGHRSDRSDSSYESYGSVLISIPSSHNVWQLLHWARPLIVTRHSMQMPMPQSGPRGWPRTERRNRAGPASATAAATIVPGETRIGWPFTRT